MDLLQGRLRDIVDDDDDDDYDDDDDDDDDNNNNNNNIYVELLNGYYLAIDRIRVRLGTTAETRHLIHCITDQK